MNKFWDGTANLSIFGRRIGYFWLAYYESDTPTGIHERMDAVVNGLKREPLSEDEIWDNLPENPMECAGFIAGVKFAEKAHGIGVVA